MPLDATPDEQGAARGALASEIANLVVRTLSEYTGRGPTRARAYIMDDLITVVVRDALTRGERSLVEDGYAEEVLQTRKMYQRTMRTSLVGGVEELTGRRVIAFCSDNHLDPDVGVESFLLERAVGEAAPE